MKQATKKTVQSVKKVAKVAKKAVKKTVKKKKKQLAASQKKAKKKVKRAKKKAKKKIGKVFTKARTFKNNLSPKQQIKKLKKNMKKAVLAKKSKKKKKEKDGFFKQAGKVLKKAAKKTALAAKSLTGANLKETLSAVVDFIPVVGNAKAAVEVITGGDPITGRKLDDWERVAAGAAMVGGAVVKGAVRTGKVVSAVAGGGKAAKKSTKSKKSEEKPKVPEKVASDVVSRVEKVVDKAVGNSTSTSKKSRSAPADTGTPNSTKVDRDTNGNITKYTTYGSDGKIVKEVRIDGKDHGSIPRPNVEEPTFNTNPKTGEQFQNGYEVRPVDPDEIPNSRK